MAERLEASIICVDGKDYKGYGYTICMSDNQVFSFGMHSEGGTGHEEWFVCTPKEISTLHSIKAVDCGWQHTICLDFDGRVFGFGLNNDGQLGVGEDVSQTHLPVELQLPPCKQVCCGLQFTICVSEDGMIYSFGENRMKQLGLGTDDVKYYLPQKLESLDDVNFVRCGKEHVICKLNNNHVYCWGDNGFGQLGTGDTVNHSVPFKCSDWPEDIVDIKSGLFNVLVLTSNLHVFSCGRNSYGELGRLTESEYESKLVRIEPLNEIIRIECGYFHSMCITVDYDLFIFGDNSNGQLGLGNTDSRKEPIKHPSLSDVIDVSKGGMHTFVKTINNEIYGFGRNTKYQAGVSSKFDQHAPVRILKGKEDIWFSNVYKSRAKSARK